MRQKISAPELDRKSLYNRPSKVGIDLFKSVMLLSYLGWNNVNLFSYLDIQTLFIWNAYLTQGF